MMNIKRAVMMAVLTIAIAALALPLIGLRSNVSASRTNALPATSAKATKAAAASTATAPQELGQGQNIVLDQSGAPQDESKLDSSLMRDMGFTGLPEGVSSEEAGRRMMQSLARKQSGQASKSLTADEPRSGQPRVLSGTGAYSTALSVAIGGRDTQFSEIVLLSDWDGREDCVADREQKVDDFSNVEIEIDNVLSRTAISEHTRANGFNENVFYYGDTQGNVFVGVDTDGATNDLGAGPQLADTFLQINLPTALNAFGSLSSDDQITITGLAVSPVSDLRSFFNVNSGYTAFQDVTDGEILYVSFWDTEGGLRLTAGNQLVRSGVLAFPISDNVSPAASTTVLSDTGFPVTVGAAFGVLFTTFCNVGGICVDDDGSLYFQQADLLNFANGANIVKVTDTGSNQDRSLAVSGILIITTLNPTGGVYGTTSGPSTQVNRFTNYSGTSTVFGNIVSIACGPCNTVYAAVSASNTTNTINQGRFTAPAAFPNGLPNMIISFADCGGGLDVCSGNADLPTGDPPVGSILPIADGFADAADFGTWRVFVVGNGPALPGGISTNAGNIPPSSQQDFQIDFSGVHSGIVVNEEGTVFFISGGAPAADIGISPLLGEILCYEDMCPMDRRADFVDLRGNGLPVPPASGGNTGDGDSDRFDHIFFIAPLDQVSIAPTGLAGLNRGFLRYMNRLAPHPIGPGVTLGVSDPVLGDDDSAGPIIFEQFDPSHQVAGGDDQNTPFRGDDNNGAGNPNLQTDCDPMTAGLQPCADLSGGFEFVFGGPVGAANCVWNGFFWNSNGNITFGDGDTFNQPNAVILRNGLPKIAPAWADLNPSSREQGNLNTYPVMAAGFANVNAFKIRWINVPEFGMEDCGSRNTFAVTLFDDGTGIDENANQALNPANPIGNNAVPFDLQEGPTDLRWEPGPVAGAGPVGCSPRGEGTGHFIFEYCRMDLLGTKERPVLVGYSIGFLDPLNPPGLCGSNLSCLAREADLSPFGVIPNCNQAQVASICPCLIGEGTEPTIFELFNTGSDAVISPEGIVTLARPSFDLRFEGNDAAACTPTRQDDNNRGKVGFFGIGCNPPPNPENCNTALGRVVIPRPTGFTPGAGTDLIDALCAIPIDIVGCGFFPNETTIICSGIGTETGLPIQRPGKSVSTGIALALNCDSNGDGINDTVLNLALTNVNPVSKNLIQAVIPTIAVGNVPGTGTSTAFPISCCGGSSTLTITTTFTDGDNNAFNLVSGSTAFTRTATCTLALGNRAPVVVSATPSTGSCTSAQDLLITGSCFLNPGTVTSVFALEVNSAGEIVSPQNRIDATFVVLSNNLLDALFNFGSANAGKTFRIFVQGPGGISRNLTPSQAAANACNIPNNEFGGTALFTCAAAGTPPGGGTTPTDVAVVNACNVKRRPSGAFQVVITGSNLKQGASVTISGQAPNKLKFKGVQSGSNVVNKILARGGICSLVPGPIIVTNPGPDAGPSQPFVCNQACSTN